MQRTSTTTQRPAQTEAKIEQLTAAAAVVVVVEVKQALATERGKKNDRKISCRLTEKID